MARRPFPRGGIRTRLPVTIYRRSSDEFSPTEISGLALWLDASSSDSLYTTDAGPVVAVASPLDIAGCVGWWDASDAASITASSGLVSQWNDRSTAGNHATASGTARPTTGTRSLNGRNVLDFDGTANALATSLADTATQTVFFVAVSDVASSSGRAWSFGTTNRGVFPNAGIWEFWRQQTSGAISFGATASATSPSVACALFTSNSSLTTFGNGAQGTTNDPVDSSGGLFNIGKESIYFHNGYIAEIVIYNTALTTAQRASVEAYLAAKWAISGVHAPATATSDPVGYWGDKSGNGRHAVQSLAGSRPAISATAQNSKRTLAFDGSNDALFGTGAQALKTGMTVIGAYAPGGVNFTSMFSVGENAAGKRWISGSSAAKVGLDWFTGNTSVAALASNRTGVNSFTFNPAANSVGIRIDGAQVLSQASLSPALAAYATDTFAVAGVPANNEQFLPGRIFELAVYNRVLSASECRRVEQALGTKWGITLAPQVSNLDAQDWINRVYANGGSVSSATAAGVNQFCVDIENAPGGSIRDRFLRLNLFCGSFQGAFVPLFRGPSLGGTQYGGTTDTNNAFVGVGTDYAETGATGGLTGNGTSKFLNTGLKADALTQTDRHLSVVVDAGSIGATGRYMIGMDNFGGAGNAFWGILSGITVFQSSVIRSQAGASNSTQFAVTGRSQILMSGNAPATAYLNGSSAMTGQFGVFTAPALDVYVLGLNRNGSVGDYFNGRLQSYSIGLGMDSTQAAAYYAAMQSFQTTMGRA